MRPHEFLTPMMIRELLRLARLDRRWVKWRYVDNGATGDQPRTYAAMNGPATWLSEAVKGGSGADWFGMFADSIWLLDGPKVFKPTLDQCRALENVEVNLALPDYRQPYPAIMVALPPEYAPFFGVIVCHEIEMLNCALHSYGGSDDIVTTVGASCATAAIETSLIRFDADCCDLSEVAARALRVAVNSCLALANWPITSALMYPKEVEADQHFARKAKNRESREAAAFRLSLPVTRVSFAQDIRFHRVEGGHESGEPTGRHVTTHWRRGHWAMQPHGPQSSLRKLIFRKSVLVRSDLFAGDTADTSTTYKG